MVTLLSLPREIRDQILQEAIFFQRHPPASPSVSQDRICLRNTFDFYWTGETNIYIERGQISNTQLSLLLTNHQLHAETKELSKRSSEVPYRLDVMVVKECGLFPTWLSYPGRQQHIDTVHVQFRIFDPSEDINPEWLERAQYGGGGDGSTRTGWNAIFFLAVYLLNGFHDTAALEKKYAADDEEAAKEEAREDINEEEMEEVNTGEDDASVSSEFYHEHIAQHTIKTVILDVLTPPADDHSSNSDPASPPEAQQTERSVFGRSIFNTRDDVVRRYWPFPSYPPEDYNFTVTPAHKLVDHLRSSIALGLDREPHYQLYSELLFEHVGAIHFRIDGVSKDITDLNEEFGIQFRYHLFATNPNERSSKWVPKVAAKRVRDGLWDEAAYEHYRTGGP